jgi:hypothetical protein
VLYVYRHAHNNEINSQHDFWQLGLYVGPSPSVPGAIRAAVLINKRVHIITTTAIKGVSDGGQVAIYPDTESSIDCLLDHTIPVDNSTSTSPVPPDPIPDEPLHIVHLPEELSAPPKKPRKRVSFLPVQPQPQLNLSSPPLEPTSVPASLNSNVQFDNNHTSQPQQPPLPLATTQNPPPIEDASAPDNSEPAQMQTTSQSNSSPVSTPSQPHKRRRKRAEPAPPSDLLQRREINRQRRQKLRDDMQARIVEPPPVPQPLASSADILAFSATALLRDIQPLACFVDWTNHTDDGDIFYFSFQDNAYIQICSDSPLTPSSTSPLQHDTVDSYRAVTENVPRTFPQALRDPVWGEPARLEFETILNTTQSLVRMDTAIARHHIQHGAEVLFMIPVYEEK